MYFIKYEMGKRKKQGNYFFRKKLYLFPGIVSDLFPLRRLAKMSDLFRSCDRIFGVF